MFWTNAYKDLRADLAAISARFIAHKADAHENYEKLFKCAVDDNEKMEAIDARYEKLFAWAVEAGERIDALEACKCRCGEAIIAKKAPAKKAAKKRK